MEKRLNLQFEKSLNLKMREMRASFGILEDPERTDCSKNQFSQTSQEDLRRAQILYQKYKVQSNPTLAILESLPGLMERIAMSLESQKEYFQNDSKKRQAREASANRAQSQSNSQGAKKSKNNGKLNSLQNR